MNPIRRSGWMLGGVAALAVLIGSAAPVLAAQKSFATADAAVSALVDAAKAATPGALDALFGPIGKRVLTSGDPIADREAREDFVVRATERTHLERVGDDFAVLSVGSDDWPFAIPLVKEKSGWIFDTAAGEKEIQNRRVGRNELDTIQICQEYVGAQREYAGRQRATNGVAAYAQRLRSTPGNQDGLYWEERPGDAPSPMGPLFASASGEGYDLAKRTAPEPFHGYVYKMLKAAGPSAPGGAHSYVQGGRMTGGFALLAYPVRYGSSGVMTFQVNEQGVVFQKDLGLRTAEIAAQIDAYDPDDSWEPTE